MSVTSDLLNYFEKHREIIQKINVVEITKNFRYTNDQSNNFEFALKGPSLVFIGNQAPGEPNNLKQALMTSWAFIETFNGDFNIEILVTIWGPMWNVEKDAEETFNFEFSVVGSNPMKIVYDNQELGTILSTYCGFKAKISDINDIRNSFKEACGKKST
ncbi:hypothetical protein EWF20_10480 [Sulfolobus sp. S-194]|uniref:hypothetical protein n=1 Tax=Sulfolobus sp. S-194 TaxID=2512240 RepID=UPI001436E0B0|nr:hypothetical protein [Sulfolobus sp. S-194]QIW24522.1 hypothetical protein EWF20_10480 [Sulfolobus sp. S-194]